MDTNVLIIGVLFAIVFGIVACFSGYRIFRFLFALLGFVAGATLGVALAGSIVLVPGQETVIRIVLGLMGGLIGAALAWFLYIVGVFLAGASIGATLGAGIALAVRAESPVSTILVIVLAIAAGILAVALQKPVIVLATAFGGAQIILSGLSRLIDGGTNLMFNPLALLQQTAAQPSSTLYVLMLAGWVVLGVLGVLVQYRVTSRKFKTVVVPATAVTPTVVAP